LLTPLVLAVRGDLTRLVVDAALHDSRLSSFLVCRRSDFRVGWLRRISAIPARAGQRCRQSIPGNDFHRAVDRNPSDACFTIDPCVAFEPSLLLVMQLC
jgi:hypothetical protein